MKGLSIKQPWTYLICSGIKTIETRVWTTQYRGDILICSSKSPMVMNYSFYNVYNVNKSNGLLLDGYALGIVNLIDVTKMVEADTKKACCNLYDAYSWHFDNLRLIEPIPLKGFQRLFNISSELIDKIKIK